MYYKKQKLFESSDFPHTHLPSELSHSIGYNDIGHFKNELCKNYYTFRRLAIWGFSISGAIMALGILVILAISFGLMFGDFTNINLKTIAGVITTAISGICLLFFKETFKKLCSITDMNHEMWKFLVAVRMAERLPDEKKAEQIVLLISALINTSG